MSRRVLSLSMCFYLSLCTVVSVNAQIRSASLSSDSNTPIDSLRMVSSSSQVSRVEGTPFELIVPREGLQAYFEIRNGRLGELASLTNTLAPLLLQSISASGQKTNTKIDMTVMMTLLPDFMRARIAVIKYLDYGAVLMVGFQSTTDAQRVSAEVAKILGATLQSVGGQTTAAQGLPQIPRGELLFLTGNKKSCVTTREKIMLAGDLGGTLKLTTPTGRIKLKDASDYISAYSKLAADPAFIYMDIKETSNRQLSAAPLPYAQAASFLGRNTLPDSISVSLSPRGDGVTMRGLVSFKSRSAFGTQTAFFSSRGVTFRGAGYISPDVDLFLDMSVDWQRFYDSIMETVQAFASTPTGEGGDAVQMTNVFTTAEKQLGFSIKNDLLPTLGNEVVLGINLGGAFGSIIPSTSPRGTTARRIPVSKPVSPQFSVLISLKDPVKFEALMGRILMPPPATGRSARGRVTSAQTRCRNAIIKSSSNMSYAIADGFFIADTNSLRVCRAIEMKATGTGLSASPDFRAGMAMGRQMVLQVFMHPRLVNDLHTLTAEIAKTNPSLTLPPPPAKPGRAPIGVIVEPDTDGLSFEVHLPASLGMLAVISALSTPETLTMPAAVPAEQTPMEPEPSTITPQPGVRRPAILTNETIRRTRP